MLNSLFLYLYLVCYPSGNDFQCRCEDRYTWTYDDCITHGACNDEATNGTCECITGIPSTGLYCQPKTGKRPSKAAFNKYSIQCGNCFALLTCVYVCVQIDVQVIGYPLPTEMKEMLFGKICLPGKWERKTNLLCLT